MGQTRLPAERRAEHEANDQIEDAYGDHGDRSVPGAFGREIHDIAMSPWAPAARDAVPLPSSRAEPSASTLGAVLRDALVARAERDFPAAAE